MLTLIQNFYPRSPCGERLRGWTLNINGPIFLSTLSLRRATAANGLADAPPQISIHALLAESDAVADLGKRNIRISIHALLAESDRRRLW